eukprot:5018903-Karenia_brevis.AAC.1
MDDDADVDFDVFSTGEPGLYSGRGAALVAIQDQVRPWLGNTPLFDETAKWERFHKVSEAQNSPSSFGPMTTIPRRPW